MTSAWSEGDAGFCKVLQNFQGQCDCEPGFANNRHIGNGKILCNASFEGSVSLAQPQEMLAWAVSLKEV